MPKNVIIICGEKPTKGGICDEIERDILRQVSRFLHEIGAIPRLCGMFIHFLNEIATKVGELSFFFSIFAPFYYGKIFV